MNDEAKQVLKEGIKASGILLFLGFVLLPLMANYAYGSGAWESSPLVRYYQWAVLIAIGLIILWTVIGMMPDEKLLGEQT